MTFPDYYDSWIDVYKVGNVREVTLRKYRMVARHLHAICPDLQIKDLSRRTYQQIINTYALTHEKQTCIDFHHHLKASILDAVDEGLIDKDPTRKVVIKGREPRPKKIKYLSHKQLKELTDVLKLGPEPSLDWLILLLAKTGLRYAEALGLQAKDIDLSELTLTVSKTWDYKNKTGFAPTKNDSSKRKIKLDWKFAVQLRILLEPMDPERRIFEGLGEFNSTVNHHLNRLCKEAGVPAITVHGLRHTHASILLYQGISVAMISKRLGHSSIATTQKVYLHLLQEMEEQDNTKIQTALCNF